MNKETEIKYLLNSDEIKEAIAEWLFKKHNISVDKASEILLQDYTSEYEPKITASFSIKSNDTI